jgi:hypothetical protein
MVDQMLWMVSKRGMGISQTYKEKNRTLVRCVTKKIYGTRCKEVRSLTNICHLTPIVVKFALSTMWILIFVLAYVEIEAWLMYPRLTTVPFSNKACSVSSVMQERSKRRHLVREPLLWIRLFIDPVMDSMLAGI